MAIKYTVTDVAEDVQRGLWQVTYNTGDGTHAHQFPKATLEWRAAEYGLDDPAEILDIILHEPYVPPEPSPAPVSVTSPSARAAQPERARVTLYTAATTEQARTAHRELIAQVKAERVRIEPPPKGPDPLDSIRARHGITPEGRRAKAMTVDIHRWKHLYGGLPLPTEEVPHA
ncbi:hypothetical protein ABZ419_11550 [Streptomyces cinnamoneus]|uniref:hypothetical protein n=1 Tax=Streptomyces cinnamoneus TaxID=53446 RepID=UPI0033C3897D